MALPKFAPLTGERFIGRKCVLQKSFAAGCWALKPPANDAPSRPSSVRSARVPALDGARGLSHGQALSFVLWGDGTLWEWGRVKNGDGNVLVDRIPLDS
jgi:hypothetical protein